MTLMTIVIGTGVLVGFAVVWVAFAKSVDGPGRSTDLDSDGAPDATPHDNQAVIEMDREEQKRRHLKG